MRSARRMPGRWSLSPRSTGLAILTPASSMLSDETPSSSGQKNMPGNIVLANIRPAGGRSTASTSTWSRWPSPSQFLKGRSLVGCRGNGVFNRSEEQGNFIHPPAAASTPVAPAYSKTSEDMKSSVFQRAFCIPGKICPSQEKPIDGPK